MQDARAHAREVRGDLAERDRIDVGTQADVVERDAARAQRVGELPRAGLVLVEHEEAHVPAALAQIGQELQKVRLRAGDARDLLGVEDDAVGHDDPRGVEDATRPRLHRVARGDALAKRVAERGSLLRAQRGERADAVGERARIPAREALLGSEELVEDRVGGQHREARGRGLVDDLVRSAGAHVVHERVVRREKRGDLRTRDGVADRDAPVELELAHELLELRAVGALVVGERRAVDVQLDVVTGERHRGDRDVEALRRGVATEREQARPGTVARRRARELVEVDPVPDRAQLPRRQAGTTGRRRSSPPSRRAPRPSAGRSHASA